MIYIDRYLDGMVPAKWKGGGHMLGTDLNELHQFAASLGLKRAWFQDDGSFPHYDLTASKRRMALANVSMLYEVTEIGAGDLPDDVLMSDRAGGYEPRHVRLARRRSES